LNNQICQGGLVKEITIIEGPEIRVLLGENGPEIMEGDSIACELLYLENVIPGDNLFLIFEGEDEEDYFELNLLSNIIDPSMLEPGDYTIIYIDEEDSGCISLKTLRIIGCSTQTASLDESENLFRLLPNLIKRGETMSIQSTGEYLIQAYALYKLTGELVQNEKDLRQANIQLSTENVTKGIYVLQLQIKDQIVNKKLVVY